jgi:hypothetical protein
MQQFATKVLVCFVTCSVQFCALTVIGRSVTEMTKGQVARTTGRAIGKDVNRRLPTVAARVRAQVRSCGICGGQSGKFYESTSVSPVNSHSIDCSTLIIYHPGLVQ